MTKIASRFKLETPNFHNFPGGMPPDPPEGVITSTTLNKILDLPLKSASPI